MYLTDPKIEELLNRGRGTILSQHTGHSISLQFIGDRILISIQLLEQKYSQQWTKLNHLETVFELLSKSNSWEIVSYKNEMVENNFKNISDLSVRYQKENHPHSDYYTIIMNSESVFGRRVTENLNSGQSLEDSFKNMFPNVQ